MMKSEDWTDELCKAVGVSGIAVANQTVSVCSVSLTAPKRYIIQKGEAVGTTGYYSDFKGRPKHKNEAPYTDIVFLEGRKVVTAKALNRAFDMVRTVDETVDETEESNRK